MIQPGLLSSRVKYVRLVKREVRGPIRYTAQLVCERMPYQKPEHTLGNETMGLDIGPSTIAIVGDTQATLTQFADEAVRDHKKIHPSIRRRIL